MTPRKSRSLLAVTLAGSLLVTGWTASAVAGPNDEAAPDNDANEVHPDLDDAIWETVYVESAEDTDGSGEPDRIAVEIVRPAETEDGEQVPVVAKPSPYYDLSEAAIANSEFQIPIAANASPAHFEYWFHEQLVPEGYAYIEPEMQGTAQSTGCPTTGGVEDTSSMEAVVDWIAGRTTAEYEDGSTAEATWAEPSVGMIGTSYEGTLPNAAAATGMEEVDAIVPIAAISSWYDYTRTQGTGLAGWDDDYVKWLADYVANPEARQNCGDLWDDLAVEADDDTFDMNELWDERNYLNHADQVDAGVLHIHGQADFNVNTTHAGQWWNELAEHDVDQKLWLHPGEHIDPTGETAETRQLVQDWFDYFLKDVDNGILDTPDVMVDREDGSTDHYDDWPNPSGDDETFFFGEDDNGVGTLTGDSSATGTHTSAGNVQTEAAIIDDPLELEDERSVFLTDPIDGDQHLSGIVEVDLTFESSTSSTPLNAVLFSYDEDGNVSDFVTYGGADAKNHGDLWQEEELVPGQEYSMNFELEPRDHVFSDGDRIGLAVVTNHPSLTTNDPEAEALDIHLGSSEVNLNLTSLS